MTCLLHRRSKEKKITRIFFRLFIIKGANMQTLSFPLHPRVFFLILNINIEFNI